MIKNLKFKLRRHFVGVPFKPVSGEERILEFIGLPIRSHVVSVSTKYGVREFATFAQTIAPHQLKSVFKFHVELLHDIIQKTDSLNN